MNNTLIVIGAGPMGLATAYFGMQAGYDVEVYEADDRVGGMAAHFDFAGLSIERYYHFCCLSDTDTLSLMKDVGMDDQMRWVSTSMGYYTGNKLHDWGDPVALLKFSELNVIEKVRYGLHAFVSTKRSDWERLDKISARDWFTGWLGQSVYDKMWRPLMDLKFYEYTDKVSAAWMWQRIKRLGNSRKSLFEEQLGYIEGGTEALMIALADQIRANGGTIHLSCPARKFLIEDETVHGIETVDGNQHTADAVISTIPTPFIPAMLSDAADEIAIPYTQIDNIGVICVMLKLKRPVSTHFWVNIADPNVEIPGIVEFSNLRPLPETVVYVPFYMPQSNDKFGRPDADFVADSLYAVQLVNPEISEADILATHVGRLRYAQPICDVGFAGKIPSEITPIKGLQIADTCFYYPEDRGVSESIKFARRMVRNLQDGKVS